MTDKALILKQQMDAVDSLGKELKKVYTAIMNETAGLEEANVMARWRIGDHAAKVTKNERQYGESAVENLAKALGGVISTQHLWECRKIATAFTESGIKKILSKDMKSGGKITYSHLKYIADLTPAVKAEMLSATFKENLTVSELGDRINAKISGGNPRGGGGRKIQPPKTIIAGLDQIGKFSDAVHKRVKVWNKAVFKRLCEGPVDQIPDDSEKRITAARKLVGQMVEDGNDLLKALDASEARVATVREEAKAAVTAAKEAAKAEGNGTAETNGSAAKKKAGKGPGPTAADRVKAAKKKKAAKRKAAAQPAAV